jgi:hypothetical protein
MVPCAASYRHWQTRRDGDQPLDLSARSEWYRALDEDDRAMIADVMRATAYAVLHTVLCVLDGVATVVEGPDNGHLRLVHATSSAARELTEPNGEADLHDLFADVCGKSS